MRFKEFVRRYLVVRKCGGCREILDYERQDEALCEKCVKRWNIAKTETCPVCSQSALECICMPKGLASTGALCLRKLYFYSPSKHGEPQNRLVYYLKKNRNRRMSAFIASELKGALQGELDVLGVSARDDAVIVNVPRSKKSRAVYGFDQSEVVCRELSAIVGAPYVKAIKRKGGGKEQKRLNRSHRFKNVKHLFEAADTEMVNGRYVILFDDVVTTGASMAACVSILKKCGAKGIICLCIAED